MQRLKNGPLRGRSISLFGDDGRIRQEEALQVFQKRQWVKWFGEQVEAVAEYVSALR